MMLLCLWISGHMIHWTQSKMAASIASSLGQHANLRELDPSFWFLLLVLKATFYPLNKTSWTYAKEAYHTLFY